MHDFIGANAQEHSNSHCSHLNAPQHDPHAKVVGLETSIQSVLLSMTLQGPSGNDHMNLSYPL